MTRPKKYMDRIAGRHDDNNCTAILQHANTKHMLNGYSDNNPNLIIRISNQEGQEVMYNDGTNYQIKSTDFVKSQSKHRNVKNVRTLEEGCRQIVRSL